MRIEDKLSQTLKRATADEPLPRDVWDAFERRARRSERMRVAVAAVGMAAVVAAGAVAIPKVLRDDPTDGVATPGPTESAPAPADPTASWKVTVNADQGFALKHPGDWRVSSFEGDTGVRSPDSTGSAEEGTNFFQVTVNITADRYDEEALTKRSGARTGEIGGHRFVGFDGTYKDEYFIDWTNHIVLYAQIATDSDLLLQRHHDTGQLVVESLRDASPSGTSVYGNPLKHYVLSLPGDWTFGEFEGADEFRPKGLPSLPQGEPTFAVQIRLLTGSGCGTAGCSPLKNDERFGGKSYSVSTSTNGGETRTVYLVEWNATPPCPPGHVCRLVLRVGTLEVSVISGSAELAGRYGSAAEDLLRSIKEV